MTTPQPPTRSCSSSLRSRLQAVVDEGAVAIEQTAVSPIVAEGKDFACNLLGPGGRAARGRRQGRVQVGRRPQRRRARPSNATAARIVAGDVFAANDPHHGGGNHPQDIEICRPVFVGDELVAWVAASAHLIDVGGMTFGSWAPDATECYQEAIRFPPVRLFAAGVEQSDTWALILNNVRCRAWSRWTSAGSSPGATSRRRSSRRWRSRSASPSSSRPWPRCATTPSAVLRERIGRLADGNYATDGWVEWGDEQYHLPCPLAVRGRRAALRLHGRAAAGPALHQLEGVPRARPRSSPTCAATSPRTCRSARAMYRPIDVVCPPGTIVDSAPPAPIASAHLDVAMNCDRARHAVRAARARGHRRRLAAAPVRGAVGPGRAREPLVVLPSRPTATSTAGC